MGFARLVGLCAVATVGLACLTGSAAASMVITGVTANSGDEQSEWVELSNVSPAGVDLSGWQIDFRSASCSLLGGVAVPEGTVVVPGGWFLVASDEAFNDGVPADLVYGEDDLVKSAGAISLSSPGSLVDAVGWGNAGFSCSETTAEALSLTGGQSLVRVGRESCPQDTNHNANDFDLQSGVVPRSSASGSNSCFPPAPTGYARPKSATPVQVSLVPAYKPCTVSNRTHGPPIAQSSCNPPALESAQLTMGSADGNGQPTNATGFARYAVIVGAPGGADDSDVRFAFELTDVRRQGTLADYAGELQATTLARITDRLNGPAANDPATGTGISFPVTVPCTATGGTANIGAICAVTTTFDAVNPGAIPEGKRAVWELGRVQVLDGGADGDVDSTPNTLFATQGVFVP